MRLLGAADLVLVPGLLAGRPRWPWMAARAALNLAQAGWLAGAAAGDGRSGARARRRRGAGRAHRGRRADRGGAAPRGRLAQPSSAIARVSSTRERRPELAVDRAQVRLDRSRAVGRRPGRREPPDGVAKESNLPSVGLPRLADFEDRLGHRPRPLHAR